MTDLPAPWWVSQRLKQQCISKDAERGEEGRNERRKQKVQVASGSKLQCDSSARPPGVVLKSVDLSMDGQGGLALAFPLPSGPGEGGGVSSTSKEGLREAALEALGRVGGLHRRQPGRRARAIIASLVGAENDLACLCCHSNHPCP